MDSKVSLSEGPNFEEKLSKVFQMSTLIYPSYVSAWWPLSKITHHLQCLHTLFSAKVVSFPRKLQKSSIVPWAVREF